jgi:hypothetical protein
MNKSIVGIPLMLALMVSITAIIPTPTATAQGSDCSPPLYDYPEPGFNLERCSESDIVTTSDGDRVYVNEQTCTITEGDFRIRVPVCNE